MTPEMYVRKTSEGKVLNKVQEVLEEYQDQSVILVTGDTVIVKDGKVFEKP